MDDGARVVRGGLLMHAGVGCMLRAYTKGRGVIGKLLLCEQRQGGFTARWDKVHSASCGMRGQIPRGKFVLGDGSLCGRIVIKTATSRHMYIQIINTMYRSQGHGPL